MVSRYGLLFSVRFRSMFNARPRAKEEKSLPVRQGENVESALMEKKVEPKFTAAKN
ncbi:MAG: hypothetical protein ACT4O3_05470 [Elusimicrobiota bacterium]|jgi:hypothetical protein